MSRHKIFHLLQFALLLLALVMPGILFTEEVGKRPYEMVNAGRTADSHPPLVDFENLDGWTVETTVGTEASFTLSREQQLWGDHVAKLTYKNSPAEQGVPVVTLKPPKPIPIATPFDCVDFWVYGNNWEWESDATTPRVSVILRLQGKNGDTLQKLLDIVRWKEWFLIHKKFSEEELAILGDAPALVDIQIQQGRNTEPRTLFFDNLSFFKEELPPLKFEPRPLRNVKLPEGQTTGTNTGPGTLPFPNREETILPSCPSYFKKNNLQKQPDGSYCLSFGGKGEEMYLWCYTPKTGTLDDFTVKIFVPHNNGVERQPETVLHISGSAIRFVEEPKEPPVLVAIATEDEALMARWKFGENEVEYRFTMKNKSLISDVRCLGGNVKEFSPGGWTGLTGAKLVKVPYLVGNGTLRPAVVAYESDLGPMFLLSMLDHTRSNASEFFWENQTEKDYVSAASCCRYNPKTDGRRNDFFERLFITVSPDFTEVLPNIPNDPSPWKHVTAERVWKAHGASNHDSDYEYWSRVKRYGMEKILVTDHETLWRDGGESFTFRTYAAPGKGGDEGQKQYTRKMHELGFIYGPYNNYTDYSPVNEYWAPDWVSRQSDGNYRNAWARCYNPKPAIAVQAEPKITSIFQPKFDFNTAYCDVHTAVQPWHYVDYDARVPGAGTLAATFYAYGEIMLHQKKIWNGPVYSEGNNHWFYSGLTDGNYAQDQAYFVYEKGLPWIVDFDLLKIHPLENNFGMGYPSMFYGTGRQYKDAVERNHALDRFLAATLAFGHTGFFATDYGFDGGVRSYFTVQQIAARYATANVKSIHYFDENGYRLTTSQAVASDAVKWNRIKVEYEDGLTIYVNGNDTTSWSCHDLMKHIADIPPNGWYVVDPKKELTAWSLDRDGCRTDYVDSPAYLFADVRDNPAGKPQRFDRLLCDRQMIVRKNIDTEGRWEMIVGEPGYAARSTLHAVRLDDDAEADAVALDFHGNELGKAETRYSRGMVHVMPVDGAFSYLLTPKKADKQIVSFPGLPGPFSRQTKAVPGEGVTIQRYDVISGGNKIPNDANPDTLYWFGGDSDKNKLDFDILPLCNVSVTLNKEKNHAVFHIHSNTTNRYEARVEVLCDDKVIATENISLDPKKPTTVLCPINFPQEPSVLPLALRVLPGKENVLSSAYPANFIQKYRLISEIGLPVLEGLPEKFEAGYCFRGGQETVMDNKTGAHAYMEHLTCGEQTKQGWAIHPPYIGGTGYTFLLSEPFIVPEKDGVTFSSEIGIRSGGDPSDGVLYRVFVLEKGQDDTLAGEINWKERSWQPLVCDLSAWQGKEIRLKLIADVGPADDSSADWAAWADLKLMPTKKELMGCAQNLLQAG